MERPIFPAPHLGPHAEFTRARYAGRTRAAGPTYPPLGAAKSHPGPIPGARWDAGIQQGERT